MTFLGVTFDTVSMTLEVTPERVVEISLLVQSWLRKKKASLKELQSLLGKLHFISSCVRPGRVFVNRLLSWLRAAFPENSTGKHRVFRNKTFFPPNCFPQIFIAMDIVNNSRQLMCRFFF
jgi:hypothetical protein